MRFSWDAAKTRANLAWHRVAFTEAMTVFADLAAIDEQEYNHPERRVLIGTVGSGSHPVRRVQ